MGKTYHYDPSDDGMPRRLTKAERKALNQRRQAREANDWIVARMAEMLAEAEKANG